MNNKTLYIIGNGFDLAHNLQTSYRHFKFFLEQISNENISDQILSKSDAIQLLSCLYKTKGLREDSNWNCFEESLAFLNIKSIIKTIGDNYDKWYDFDANFYEKLHTAFECWINSIDITSETIYDLDKNAIFLNFNYTTTLEKIYNIKKENIIYIHSRQEKEENKVYKRLIFGHRTSRNDIKKYIDETLDPNSIFKDKITDFLSSFEKPIDSEINSLEFQELIKIMNNISTVKIIGHSLGDIDKPYFEKLLDANKNNTWIKYYLDKNFSFERIKNLPITEIKK